jgi:hypothetical protein
MLEETVEAKVEHDKYVAALEAVKKQDNNLYKQVKKLRRLVQQMPPLHPSRPDAMLQLSTGLLGFGSGRGDVRDGLRCSRGRARRVLLTLTLTG